MNVRSVVERPLVLLQEGVHHLLHGEVGDELVRRQLHAGHGVEVTHTLLRKKIVFFLNRNKILGYLFIKVIPTGHNRNRILL